MSEQEPTGPYVYQPYGALTDPQHNEAGRLWGVSGVSMLTTIMGLTKDEAEAVCRTLKAARELANLQVRRLDGSE